MSRRPALWGLVLLFWAAVATAQNVSRRGTTLADTPMFFKGGVSTLPSRIIPAGTDVEIIGRDGRWFHIILHDPVYGDDDGYVDVKALKQQDTGDTSFGGGGRVSQRGFLEGRWVGFPQAAANDATRSIGDFLVRQEIYLKPRRWLQIAGGLDFRANSHEQVEDEWRFDLEDRRSERPRLSVRRLAAKISAGRLTVDAGRQFIRWGRADVLNPTDRFAPRDYLTVIDTDFLAVNALRPSLRLGGESLEAVWVPRMTPSRMPLLSQRWSIVPPEAAGFTLVDNGAVFENRGEWGARWAHAGGNLEVAASIFDGFNDLPTLSADLDATGTALRVTRQYPRLTTYGIDAGAPLPWFSFKGEAVYFKSPEKTADDYVLYVLELERQVGEWSLVGGYAGESVVNANAAFPFAPDRGIAKSFLGRAAYTVNPRRSLALEGAIRQSGDGAFVKTEFSEALSQHWRFTANSVIVAGKSDDFLGQFRRNSNATVALRLSY